MLKKQTKMKILKFWILVDQDAYMGALVLALGWALAPRPRLGLGRSLALGLGPLAKAWAS